VLARHALPTDGRDRWLGDLALGRDGSVYASDSKGGGLFRLVPGGALRLVAQSKLESPQGLVETADGTALIVADYATGLHRIALADGADSLLDPSKAQLRGIDGLERDGDALVATQNGTVPNRVLRIALTPGERGVAAVDELARGPIGIDDVALGTIVGRSFLFVAHSQWSATGADGRFTTTPAPARIASAPLP
jgi:sugar lactone lactonase YvrE